MARSTAFVSPLPATLPYRLRNVSPLQISSHKYGISRRGQRQSAWFMTSPIDSEAEAESKTKTETKAETAIGTQVPVPAPSSSKPIIPASKPSKRFYLNMTGFPFPLRPFLQRKTIMREMIPNTMWSFEQEHGLGGTFVAINIRMTVIRLQNGDLWVYNPIAPTEECLQLLAPLGSIKHIVLGTFAYEHKIFVGPFSRKFPKAQIWCVKQWSFPINLPQEFFGIFNAKELKNDDSQTPWAKEIDQKVVGPVNLGIAPYSEAVFFHRATKTLLVTDAVVKIPRTPPEVVDPKAIKEGAEDRFYSTFRTGFTEKPITEFPKPTTELGWARVALLASYFGPFDLLHPEKSFDALADRLIVAPVVRKLVYSRISKEIADFAMDVAACWNFDKVIPAHFEAPVKADSRDWLEAFSFLLEDREEANPLPEEDFETLDNVERVLLSFGLKPSTLKRRKRY
eukprot:CAMPEP_0184693020 /NCGR_PEP_ID=MMETSP0313-20130426/1324_1 /TAXON_ID=2792 /ORGANISM="Porphyridium aerugineum, Strain SAG 1380-2" /LENGTH=452 /DNA_ID=CAMNT_0027150967 /DNA_START=125 /DNA_END=1483 /DNA_ORIENTATION=-